MSPESPQRVHDYQIELAGASLPDFDEIDKRLAVASLDHPAPGALSMEWENLDRCSVGGEILLKTLELLLPDSRLSNSSPHSMGVRALALLWMVGSSVHDVGSLSQSQLSKEVGCSRAALSYWCRYYEKKLGIHARGQKTVSGAAAYEESSVKGWKTRRKLEETMIQDAVERTLSELARDFDLSAIGD